MVVNHLGLSPYEASLLGGAEEVLVGEREWRTRFDAEGRVEVVVDLPVSAVAPTRLVFDQPCLQRLARLFLQDLVDDDA